MSTPATPFAGAAPRLSPARVIAVIATSVLVLFGVLLGGRAFIAAAGGPRPPPTRARYEDQT